jgi:hypothetical protein
LEWCRQHFAFCKKTSQNSFQRRSAESPLNRRRRSANNRIFGRSHFLHATAYVKQVSMPDVPKRRTIDALERWATTAEFAAVFQSPIVLSQFR